jgi:hypothetical protein
MSWFRGGYKRGMDWWMDLLTTYTHHLELQVITALLLIHSLPITTAPTKPFSSLLFLHQLFPSSGFWQWRFFCFMCSCSLVTASCAKLNWTELISKPSGYNISVRITKQTSCFLCCSPTVALLRICCLTMGTCLPSHCPETVAVYRVTA